MRWLVLFTLLFCSRLLREEALREAIEVCDDAVLAEVFLLEGFPVLEERVDRDDHADVRAVGRAQTGIGIFDDETFFGDDAEFFVNCKVVSLTKKLFYHIEKTKRNTY